MSPRTHRGSPTPEREESLMRKKSLVMLVLILALGLTLSGCNNPRAEKQGVWYNPFSWGDRTLEESLAKGCRGGALSTTIGGSTYQCGNSPAPAPAPANSSLWGTAGQAPQTAKAASDLLNVPIDALTPQNVEAGNPLIIGWVVGKPPYGTKYTANLPAGVTVDYTRSSGTITGTPLWHVAYDDADWNRVLMSSQGTAEGAKFTVWWSKGNVTDGRSYKLIGGTLPQ